jgi:hypothetical protein
MMDLADNLEKGKFTAGSGLEGGKANRADLEVNDPCFCQRKTYVWRGGQIDSFPSLKSRPLIQLLKIRVHKINDQILISNYCGIF